MPPPARARPKARRNGRKESPLKAILIFAAVAALFVGVAAARVTDDSPASVPTTHLGKTAQQWYARWKKEHKFLTIHGKLLRTERRKTYNLSRQLVKTAARVSEPVLAIWLVFGSYASQAMRVVSCESGFSTRAVNGQYLGMFQMGSWERRTFGHGDSALHQSMAAYRYFVATGYDWSPWECKP